MVSPLLISNNLYLLCENFSKPDKATHKHKKYNHNVK